MTKRTEAQARAIEKIDENLAVKAGAGTGKTKVLTERYIEILDRGDLEKNREIESIVAITFTKKASQEMRERIREEIRSRFDQDPKWRDYYRDMEKGNISTIHSFCGNILKENPREAGLDPLFNIMDELKTREILMEFIDRAFKEDRPYTADLYKILLLLGQDYTDGLGENIYSIYIRAKSNGDLMEDLRDRSLREIESIEIREDIDSLIIDDFSYLMAETRSNSKFNKLAKEPIWEDYKSGQLDPERRLDILSELQNYIGANKKNQEVVERLESNIELALLEKEKHFLWAYKAIFDLLIDLESAYEEEKKRQGLLDYNDLEYRTYQLLKNNPDIREYYQDKFRYIMVDEFQDTNEIQKEIFYSLASREEKLDRNNLFVVGDPKQSIYGFRGADVQVFDRVIDDIEKYSGNPPVDMDKNFRSKKTIISFVNTIFENLIEDYDELDYHHESSRLDRIEIIDQELEIEEGVDRAYYNKAYEASQMADRIEDLVGTGDYSYGDFALLFRASTNDVIYEDALRTRGIPFYNSGGANLYERQEIIDIMNLLRSLSNGYDLIASLGLLRSPMVGLNDESIYRIFIDFSSGNIYRHLEKIELEDRDEQDKLEYILDIRKKYRYRKNLYSLSDLVEELLEELDYKKIVLLYQDGEQRFNNIDKFLDLLANYELEENSSLEGFIDYMDRLENYQFEESQAKIKSEGADVVKLMTIHKSKGLQFPVVLLPELSRGSRVERDNLIYNRRLGMALKYEKKASFYERIKSENMQEDEEEARRILYVAMTRAEDILILGQQGSKRGFKALLNEIDYRENIKYLDYDFRPADYKNSLKKISRQDLDAINPKVMAPNLIEFENYGARKFQSVNVSQFIEFRRCRRRFYYEYYRPLPDLKGEEFEGDKVLSAKDRGNIVHSFCEVYRGEEDYRSSLSRIVESYNYDYSQRVEDELKVFIDNYLEFYTEDYDKIYSEEYFNLKIEDSLISGIIDRIYIRDDKAYVYDFKTNLLGDREDLIDFYSPQLKLYGYVVEKLFGLELAESNILFLEDGEIVRLDTAREELEKNLLEIGDFIKFINNHSQLEDYERGEACQYCPYSSICF